MNCRFCNSKLTNTFVDLNSSPPSNSFLSEDQFKQKESRYPLLLHVCTNCYLVQIDEYKNAEEIFSSDYVYFSSFSKSWLEHCKQFSEKIIPRLALDDTSHVVEVASNDGYLLQYFKQKNIPVLGIEPTNNTAAEAIKKGIPSITEFFGTSLAERLAAEGKKADLLMGNNVLAHVPDINDFVGGLKTLLKPKGVVTMEFPHLVQLIENNQFDTIYHEHFSYLSLITVTEIFLAHGLQIFDVDEIPTHGGSLRIYARNVEDDSQPITERYLDLMQTERDKGVDTAEYYKDFSKKVEKVREDLMSFIAQAKQENKKIVGYGAAAKGNTLMNYCGINSDMIDFVVDASPHKQGKFLPGSHIPVVSEDELKEQKPDYVIILPWNIKEEIIEQLSYIRDWGGAFIVAVPELLKL